MQCELWMSNLWSFLKIQTARHTWTENWDLKKVQVRKRAQGPGNGRARRERLPEVQSMRVSVIGTVRKMHPETIEYRMQYKKEIIFPLHNINWYLRSALQHLKCTKCSVDTTVSTGRVVFGWAMYKTPLCGIKPSDLCPALVPRRLIPWFPMGKKKFSFHLPCTMHFLHTHNV